MSLKKYFQELQRRHVIKAGIAYLVVAWLIVQVASVILPVFEAPPYVMKVLLFLLGIGFPINLVFAWIYDVTPEGIKKTESIAKAEPGPSRKGKRLNRIIISSLVLVILLLLFNQFWLRPNSSALTTSDEMVADSTDTFAKTIAVLPLKNWSGDPNLEYISDGMTDAVIIGLTKIHAIDKVIPFTTILSYKKSDKSIADIAEELGVKNILQGSFQLSGNDFMIRLQMINGKTEKQFWDNEYNGVWNSREIFKIQALVMEDVASKINAEITESEQKRIQRIPTENAEAYRFHLQAQYQVNQMSLSGFENARQLHEKAIELDPDFIEPYIGLATDYLLSGLVWGARSEKEAWDNAKPIFEKARELDSLGGGIYKDRIKMGLLTGQFLYEWDIANVEKGYYETPNRLNVFTYQGDLFTFYDYTRKTGKFEESLIIAENYIEGIPIPSLGYVLKACSLYFLGRGEEALKYLDSNDRLFESDYYYLMETARYYLLLGDLDKSETQLGRFKNLFDDRAPIILWLNAFHANRKGKTEIARNNLAQLKELSNKETSGSPAWFLALYYCQQKEYEKTFEWLQKSYDRHEVEMTWLMQEPVLRPLWNDPRYLELYEKVGFPERNVKEHTTP